MVIKSQTVIKNWDSKPLLQSYYKEWLGFITKCDRLLLQSASGITKYDRCYYKVRQVLQSATIITKWDATHEHRKEQNELTA